jgi:hypothetical protein
MSLSEITTNRQYVYALREIESLMHAQEGTAEGFRLVGLVSIVQNFERNKLAANFESISTIPVKCTR